MLFLSFCPEGSWILIPFIRNFEYLCKKIKDLQLKVFDFKTGGKLLPVNKILFFWYHCKILWNRCEIYFTGSYFPPVSKSKHQETLCPIRFDSSQLNFKKQSKRLQLLSNWKSRLRHNQTRLRLKWVHFVSSTAHVNGDCKSFWVMDE